MIGRSQILQFALGLLLFAAMIVGGGSAPFIVTEFALQIAALTICTAIMLTKEATRLDPRVLYFPLLAMCAIAVQLIPLPIAWVSSQWPVAVSEAWKSAGSPIGVGFLTTSFDRTLSCLIYFTTASVLLWTLNSLQREQIGSLQSALEIGILANLVLAIFQLSVRQFEPIEDILPYALRAGFFVNRNHFATMLVVTIPPLFYRLRASGGIGTGAALAVVLFFILATGSIAGIAIGLTVFVLSAILLLRRVSRRWGIAFGLVVLVGVFAVFGWGHVVAMNMESKLARVEIWTTSLQAIQENWRWGTGYGTFVAAYQIYERAADISSEYVNHAHNEFVELVMEGGVIAAVLLILYLLIIVLRVAFQFGRPEVRVAFLVILSILTHSLVEYPLRTMSILCIFVFAHALMFMPKLDEPRSDEEQEGSVQPVSRRHRRSRGHELPAPG